MRLKMSVKDEEAPSKLDRAEVTSADKRHLGGHDRHEQDIGIERQARHVQHRSGDVLSGLGSRDAKLKW
jgi:hypothetical protein